MRADGIHGFEHTCLNVCERDWQTNYLLVQHFILFVVLYNYDLNHYACIWMLYAWMEMFGHDKRIRLKYNLKGLHLKLKICWRFTDNQASPCRWIWFFIGKDLDKYTITSCSPMDYLQWMGAVRMRVQTADKSITVINTTPVHQLTSCEVKSCIFVKNKSIIKAF